MAVEKKKFFEIDIPIVGEKVELLGINEESLIGRTINLDLTRKLRGKSVEAMFKVKSVDGKLAIQPLRLHLLGYFIRRMIRTSISYIEDSFSVECKDFIIRVKPFMMTRKKVSRTIKRAIRDKAKEVIQEEVKEKSFEEIFSDIISTKFQRNLSIKLKKVYPLGFCEIRDIFIESEKAEISVEKI